MGAHGVEGGEEGCNVRIVRLARPTGLHDNGVGQSPQNPPNTLSPSPFHTTSCHTDANNRMKLTFHPRSLAAGPKLGLGWSSTHKTLHCVRALRERRSH